MVLAHHPSPPPTRATTITTAPAAAQPTARSTADPPPATPSTPTEPPPADWVAAVTRSSTTSTSTRRNDTAEVSDDTAEQRPTAPPRNGCRDDSSWQLRALAAERRARGLEQALDRRPAIEQAKGLLMGVFGLDADAAFDVLVWASQHANIKVYAVAEQLVRAARASAAGTTSATGEQLTHILHGLVYRTKA